MSHELPTPLNAIIGFSEVLSDGDGEETLTPLQKEHIGYVLESGHHLLHLINDVLDLSKIEAGRIELHREWVLPKTLVDSVSEIGRALAMKQGVELEAGDAAGCRPLFVDPVRIKQVLINLISNAVKFTPQGGRVRVTTSEEQDRVAIAVEDTGVGISAEDMPRLFREFERIESKTDGPKPEGTGLGLALTRRLVELHGGVIHVESEPSKGSTFTVLLPRDAPPAPTG
jgi:signal transduction histidine kinase